MSQTGLMVNQRISFGNADLYFKIKNDNFAGSDFSEKSCFGDGGKNQDQQLFFGQNGFMTSKVVTYEFYQLLFEEEEKFENQ